MLIKHILFLTTLITMTNTFAQPIDYCHALRNEFQNEIDNGRNMSEITYRYHKLLNTCGVSEDEKEAISEAFNEMKYEISWRADNSFYIISLPDPSIDWAIYEENVSFDHLFQDDPIREKYPTIEALLKEVQIDVAKLSREPRFLKYYNVIWVAHDRGGVVLDMDSLQTLISIDQDHVEMNYAGGGVFLVRQDKQYTAYQSVKNDDSTALKKIIDQPGFAAKTIPVKSDEAYISIVSEASDRTVTSVYNNQGKLLFENQHQVSFSPLSRTIILSKDGQYRLLDYALNVILQDAEYIFEVWKDDLPYYLYDDADGKRHVYDQKGTLILSGKEYKNISINQTPYAIVRKNKEYGVIDFVTQDILVPFQPQRIHQLCPGFMAIAQDAVVTIFDEKNRRLGQIKAQSLDTLTSRSKVLLKVVAENGKEGVCDLFGKEIVPAKYDAVEYKELEQKLLITSGQTQFYTDLNGKETNP